MCGSYGRCRMLKRRKNPDCNLESECLPKWWHWRLWAERWLELRRSYTALRSEWCELRMTFRVRRYVFCPRAGCGQSACPVVCPAKAGVFSRRQSCRGRSQQPRSLDSRVEGNRSSEAYRQSLPWGGCESLGRNNSERTGGPENV